MPTKPLMEVLWFYDRNPFRNNAALCRHWYFQPAYTLINHKRRPIQQTFDALNSRTSKTNRRGPPSSCCLEITLLAWKSGGFQLSAERQKTRLPFVASIHSVLPIVDKFIVALGSCDDDTEKYCAISATQKSGIRSGPKRIVAPVVWNKTRNRRPLDG